METKSSSGAGGWADRVERLIGLIPGLGRYQDREGLRETDQRLRVSLADRLVESMRLLEPAERRLVEARRLERLTDLDRVRRRLATAADRLRFASYGFAGVFDLHKIRETELAELHRFDLALLERLEPLRERLGRLAAAEGEAFAEALGAAERGVEEFAGLLDERDRLARGL